MSDDEGTGEALPPTLAATRSRREKSDKFGRFAALKKYKASFIYVCVFSVRATLKTNVFYYTYIDTHEMFSFIIE